MFTTTAKRVSVFAAAAVAAVSGLAMTATEAHAMTTTSAMIYSGIGATVRIAPTTHSDAVGTMKQWSPIDIACYVRGPQASGSNIWYRIINPTVGGDAGRWVIASATSNTNAAGVRMCTGGTPSTAVTTTAVRARTGASTLDPVVTTLARGTRVTVTCKVQGTGSSVWYRTSTGKWVAGAYLRPAHAVQYCGVPQVG